MHNTPLKFKIHTTKQALETEQILSSHHLNTSFSSVENPIHPSPKSAQGHDLQKNNREKTGRGSKERHDQQEMKEISSFSATQKISLTSGRRGQDLEGRGTAAVLKQIAPGTGDRSSQADGWCC